jgi:hypothetical protein
MNNGANFFRTKRAVRKMAYDTSFETDVRPVLHIFGQRIEFHCGSPKQLLRALWIVAKLRRLTDRASIETEKLRAHLEQIERLHSQLFNTTSSEGCPRP